MAKSTFTLEYAVDYIESRDKITLAGSVRTVPPAAPIQCGCNQVLFLLKDPAVVLPALQGVLKADIVNVTVDENPVPNWTPSNGGASGLVWRFVYTFSINTTDLVDAAYQVRKCDIEEVCCNGCTLKIAARLYVTDAEIPALVKLNETNTSLALNTTTLNFTNEDAVVTAIPLCPVVQACETNTTIRQNGTSIEHVNEDAVVSSVNVCPIVDNCLNFYGFASANDCTTIGVGPNRMVRSGSIAGAVLTLDAAPEHYNRFVGGPLFAGAVNDSGELSVTLTNDTCRLMRWFGVSTMGLTYAQTSTAARPPLEVAYDGGAFIPTGGLTATNGADFLGSLQITDPIDGGFLAAGASVTVKRRWRAGNGFAGFSPEAWACSIRLYGFTTQ